MVVYLKKINSCMGKIKGKIKAGASVKLIVGSKESRGQVFKVSKVTKDSVFLEGYKVVQRTCKVTESNQETHKPVHHGVHISNVSLVESK